MIYDLFAFESPRTTFRAESPKWLADKRLFTHKFSRPMKAFKLELCP